MLKKTISFALAIAHLVSIDIKCVPEFGSRTSSIEFSDTSSYFILRKDIDNINGRIYVPDENNARISGGKLHFKNGIFSLADKDIAITGTYNPTTKRIILENGDSLIFPSGDAPDKEIYITTSAHAVISGSPNLLKPITLQDSTSSAHFNLQTRLGQTLNLNGGKVILDGDLAFTADSQISGGGTIDIAKKKLLLPGGQFANAGITYDNAKDITLNANVTYTTLQKFGGAGGDFIGSGFDCLLSPSAGKFQLTAGQTVNFINVNFKGLSGNTLTSAYGVVDIAPTATAYFQGCTFDLVGTYTFAQGTMVMRNNCKIITHGNQIHIPEFGAFIVLDSCVFEYETLDSFKTYPMVYVNRNFITPLNNGIFRSTTALNSPLNLNATTDTMTDDFTIATTCPFNILNATPGTPKNVTIIGNGYSVIFPSTGSNLFNIGANVNLTLNSVTLLKYNKDIVSYGDANASMKFGTGCIIDLASNTTLESSDKAWDFIGNSTILGKGTNLTINSANKITVAASTTLTISGLTLFINNPAAISMTDSTSKIIFQNCNIKMGPNGMTVSAGNIDIVDNVGLWGGDPTVVDGHSAFTFSSPGLFNILSLSTLTINRYTDFYYAANPSADAGIVYNQKRHFKISDPSATFELKGGALHSTATGLALDYGRFLISDSSKLISEGSYGTEAEFGSSLDWYHCPGCTLIVTGSLSYGQTTFP